MHRPGVRAGPRLGFLEHRGQRVAYATLGAGPVLLCDLGRLHHLDVFWRYPPYRRLVEALAQRFTVLRWDRPGCGLSERGAADFTVDGEVTLFDRLLEELGAEEVAVLASASSAPAMIAVAALRPGRVSRLAVFGSRAHARSEAADYLGVLDALLRTKPDVAIALLAHWAASGCGADAVRWLAGAYRQAASAEVIRQCLAQVVELDVRRLLGRVQCPTLVLHRRDSTSVEFQQARDVAAGIPDAVLLPLDGSASIIWEGDRQALLLALTRFFAEGSGPEPSASRPGLTAREQEVAELVALGLSNAGIGERLGIGRRTVESHVERLRAKLGLLTRAEVAAWTRRIDRRARDR